MNVTSSLVGLQDIVGKGHEGSGEQSISSLRPHGVVVLPSVCTGFRWKILPNMLVNQRLKKNDGIPGLQRVSHQQGPEERWRTLYYSSKSPFDPIR